MCCNIIKWVHKTWQVYDLKAEMVRDAQFLRLNVNDSYNHNMNSVELSYQLQNVYQFYHHMCKYKMWWYILFWCHGLILVNVYTIYKTIYEEVKVKSMSHYEFWRLVWLAKIDPTKFGCRDHMVSLVQDRGIRENYGIHLLITFQHKNQKKINDKRVSGRCTCTSLSQLERLHRRRHC